MQYSVQYGWIIVTIHSYIASYMNNKRHQANDFSWNILYSTGVPWFNILHFAYSYSQTQDMSIPLATLSCVLLITLCSASDNSSSSKPCDNKVSSFDPMVAASLFTLIHHLLPSLCWLLKAILCVFFFFHWRIFFCNIM